LQHHLYVLLLGGRLYRAPISANANRVLDYGTGTGIWAIMFADEHPHVFVIGNDLSPIQPGMVPPNCQFYVDDVEGDWVYGPHEAFDFIHGRTMCGSITDWDSLHQNCFEHLNPGGWVELQDFEACIWQIDDAEGKGIQNMTKWLALIDEASSRIGKRINVITQQKEKLKKAGFINVRDDVYPVCISACITLADCLGPDWNMAQRQKAQRAGILAARTHGDVRRSIHTGLVHSYPPMVCRRDSNHDGKRHQ
jgi:SAM-dependent methyltransferase